MLNILHVYKTSYPLTKGGVEQFIAHLCLTTDPGKVKHTVLALHAGKEELLIEESGVAFLFIPLSFQLLSTPFSLTYLKRYRELSKKADLLHYHYPFPFADLLHVLCKPSKPSLVTYHSDIVRQKLAKLIYAPLGRAFLRSVDQIVVSSANYLQSSKDLQAYYDKTEVIPFGLNPELIPPFSETSVERWRRIVGEGFFLFVGAHRYYKGLTFLIKAAEKYGMPLVIAGTGQLTDMLQAESKSSSFIHWVGLVDEESKYALTVLAKAIVLPSHLRSEAFGISLLEGLYAGKPLICCEIGTGTSYLNEHNVTGLVVLPADINALGKAMQRLTADDALCNTFATNARRRFQQLFQAEKMVSSYTALYQMLAAKSTG